MQDQKTKRDLQTSGEATRGFVCGCGHGGIQESDRKQETSEGWEIVLGWGGMA